MVELIEQLIADDLQAQPDRPDRGIPLGNEIGGGDVRIPVYGTRVLVTGDSAGGKSKLAIGMLEQLMDREYQTLVIDPEGDYQSVEGPIVLGTMERAPTGDEVMQVLRQSDKSCVVSFFAAKTEEQPPLFSKLYRALQDHRVHTGKPHWSIVDEAHYPISCSWKPIDELHLEDFHSVMYVTAFPEQMLRSILNSPLIYSSRLATSRPRCCRSIVNCSARRLPHWSLQQTWTSIAPLPGGAAKACLSGFGGCRHVAHQRHQHQYFDGSMDPENRFYFRGPKGTLNLAADNLRTFMQLAEGVDNETWVYHLKRGDYACWFRDKIQNEELAAVTEQLQRADDVSPQDSRQRVLEMIRKLYVKDL